MYEELDEAVALGIKEVKERQKHLKIEDRFGAKWWRVVDCYRADPLAENESDEKTVETNCGSGH